MDRKVRKFLKSWSKTNQLYQSAIGDSTCRIALPDPIQREMLRFIYPKAYKKDFLPSGTKTYDFKDSNGNFIELKSGLRGGNIPFGKGQTNCFRIIFFVFDSNSLEVHEIAPKDVAMINQSVTGGTSDINLTKYTSQLTCVYTLKF